jgi:hypothetical protein
MKDERIKARKELKGRTPTIKEGSKQRKRKERRKSPMKEERKEIGSKMKADRKEGRGEARTQRTGHNARNLVQIQIIVRCHCLYV